MEFTPSLILDLAFLAVLLLVAFIYAHKGFLAGIIQFAGNLASLIGAVVLSQKGATLFFDRVLRDSYTTKVENAITQSGGADLEALAEQYGGFLPQSIREKILESAQELTGSAAPKIARTIVTDVLEPLTTPLIAIVLFFICFAVFRLAVSLVAGLLQTANHIPVLGSVNKSLGFCLGLLAGCVDVYILSCVLWSAMVVTSGQLPWLNEQTLSGSWVLRLFGYINPFV